MSARDVIAQAICERWFNGNDVSRDDKLIADIALSALIAAGYRLIGPGELDRETIERCVEIVDSHAPATTDMTSTFVAEVCDDIAAALRSLQGGDDA